MSYFCDRCRHIIPKAAEVKIINKEEITRHTCEICTAALDTFFSNRPVQPVPIFS